jgi:hypothetical protein
MTRSGAGALVKRCDVYPPFPKVASRMRRGQVGEVDFIKGERASATGFNKTGMCALALMIIVRKIRLSDLANGDKIKKLSK